jgi:hypothetical protein
MTSLLGRQELETLSPIELSSRPARSQWVVPMVLLGIAGMAAVASTGFLEADEITHFLNSKKVWSDWRAVLSIWGRLGCTALYAPAAAIGLTAARLTSLAVTVAVGCGTVQLLRYFLPREGGDGGGASWIARHATALAWLLLFAQPMFALNSFTVMTEMLLACTWVWAAVILLASRARPGRGVALAGLVLGLGGWMRPEGWLAVAAWPVAAWLWLSWRGEGLAAVAPCGRRIVRVVGTTIAAVAPTGAWYLLGVWGLGTWWWVADLWPWSAASQYGKTGLLFLLSAAVSMGLWMWPLIGWGAWTVMRAARRELQDEGAPESVPTQGRQAALLLVMPLVGVFAVHGLLGSLGLFGSMSLPRYFLCVAPMGTVLALVGAMRAEWRFRRSRRRGQALRAILVGMPAFTLLALIATGYLPMWKLASTRRMDLAAEELRQRVEPAARTERLILGHPYLIHVLGLELGTQVERRASSGADLATAPAGTILVIHQNLWTKEGRWGDEGLRAWGYREDEAFASRMREIREWHPVTPEPGALGEVRIWVKQ